MILPDINLLLYAYDSGSASHQKAAAWWQSNLSGNEAVGLPPVVVFGFIRIATNLRVFENPMTVSEALRHVRSWLDQPSVQLLDSRAAHVHAVLAVLEKVGAAANLVTDAQIAALAIEHNAVLHTADADFIRFPALRWFNPLTGASSANRRDAR